jgi:hypothetical protein
MIEYAILIVMVILAIGFGCGSSSKRKSQREDKRFSKERSTPDNRRVRESPDRWGFCG